MIAQYKKTKIIPLAQRKKITDISKGLSEYYSILRSRTQPYAVRQQAYVKGIDLLDYLPESQQKTKLTEMLDIARTSLGRKVIALLKEHELYEAYKSMTSPLNPPSRRRTSYELANRKINTLGPNRDRLLRIFANEKSYCAMNGVDYDIIRELRKNGACQTNQEEILPWRIPGINNDPPEDLANKQKKIIAKWKQNKSQKEQEPRKKHARVHRK